MPHIDITAPTVGILLSALLIFLLRVVDVSLGTVRTILIMRGMRRRAALLGFVEVTIWVVAISQVISGLANVWKILGYSGGFAAGTYLGMWIETRLALGDVDVGVVSQNTGFEIASALRDAGFGVTEIQGQGRDGPVDAIVAVAARRQVSQIVDLIKAIDRDAFVTIDDVRNVTGGHRRMVK